MAKLQQLQDYPLSTDLVTQEEFDALSTNFVTQEKFNALSDIALLKTVGGVVSGDGLSVFQNSLGVLSGNFIQSNSSNVYNYSSRNAFIQAEEAGSDGSSYGPAYTGTKGFCILSVDRTNKAIWLSGNVSALANLYDGSKTALSDKYAGTFPINSRLLRVYEGKTSSSPLNASDLSNLYYSFALSSGSGTRFRISNVMQHAPIENDPILSDGYGIAYVAESLPTGLTAVPAAASMDTYVDLWNNDDNAVYCPGFPEVGNTVIENFYAQHAEGGSIRAIGKYSHAEGRDTMTDVRYAHVEGSHNVAGEMAAHAEGFYTLALERYTHSEGNATSAIGRNSHAEGLSSVVNGESAHAEGLKTFASQLASHAEGGETVASGRFSHAEGWGTKALSVNSSNVAHGTHAEGIQTQAGNGAVVTNFSSGLNGIAAHAEGGGSAASGRVSHAEGLRTLASGIASHSEGVDTEAKNQSEHAQGQYNKSNREGADWGLSGNTLHSIGYGTLNSGRKNAVEVMQDGKVFITGVGGYNGTNPTSANVKDLVNVVNDITTTLNNVSTDLSNYVSANTEYVQIGTRSNGKNSLSGVAIGAHAIVLNNGIAIGLDSHAHNNGVAIGRSTKADSLGSIAIGYNASIGTNVSRAVQIGQGTNNNVNSFKFLSTEIVNSDGKIPHADLDIDLESTFAPLSGGLIPADGEYPTLVLKCKSYENNSGYPEPRSSSISFNGKTYDMAGTEYATSVFHNVSTDIVIVPPSHDNNTRLENLTINSVPLTKMYENQASADLSLTLDTNTVMRISYRYFCLSPDTEILMGDFKTAKQLKDIKPGDEIASFDPYDGTPTTDTVTDVSFGSGTQTDVWTFEDGTIIKTVGRHRFYNHDLNEFMYLEAWNRGENAVKSDKRYVQLIKHERIEGKAQHATLFTEKYNNYFANGLLAGNRRSAPIYI